MYTGRVTLHSNLPYGASQALPAVGFIENLHDDLLSIVVLSEQAVILWITLLEIDKESRVILGLFLQGVCQGGTFFIRFVEEVFGMGDADCDSVFELLLGEELGSDASGKADVVIELGLRYN